ncbi:hypothetical protein GCK32_008534 [Trichostrongylus colubriformis]|uniref:CCHC-type domain-containing protein n=1 Tax=Trichostrongylus colubriformis TaxID=6319 RepID=A0AAN8G887_TRICO
MESLKTSRTRIESTLAKVRTAKDYVNESIDKLHVVFEMLGETKQETELSSFEEYLETGIESISEANQFCIKLSGRKKEVEQLMANLQSLQPGRVEERDRAIEDSYHSTPTSPAFAPAMPMYLPRLEIPRFSGNRAEWDNFWAIFSVNIHEQNISPMLKFNYLWQYLEGDARALVSRYQVSEENYPEAISCLCKKYGDNDTRVEELFAELQKSKADTRTTKSQTELLERISATMSQLAIKGQDVDHRLLLNTIFSKFDADIQTRALERRADLQNPRDWTWATMQKELSGILQRREYVEETRKKTNAPTESSISRPSQPVRDFKIACMYCRRLGHQSTNCRVVTQSERISFLTKKGLCLNCGKPYHTAEMCRNPPCRNCGKKHNISLCGIINTQHGKQIPQEGRQSKTKPAQPAFQQQTRLPARNTGSAYSKKATKGTTVNHQNMVIQKDTNVIVDSEDENIEDNTTGEVSTGETLLLTGTATIWEKMAQEKSKFCWIRERNHRSSTETLWKNYNCQQFRERNSV